MALNLPHTKAGQMQRPVLRKLRQLTQI